SRVIRRRRPVTLATGREYVRNVVVYLQPGPKFLLQAFQNIRRVVGATVVNRDDLVVVPDMTADRSLQRIRAIANTHETADTGQPFGNLQIGRRKPKIVDCNGGHSTSI